MWSRILIECVVYIILGCTAVTRACITWASWIRDLRVRISVVSHLPSFPDPASDGRVSNGDRSAVYDSTQERATKICLVGPLGVSVAQGLLPVGMATSHCSVGVAVDAVLVMVAEVTVSRPDALRFFGYRDYYSWRACALEDETVRFLVGHVLAIFHPPHDYDSFRPRSLRESSLPPKAHGGWDTRLQVEKIFDLCTLRKGYKNYRASPRHWWRRSARFACVLNRRESYSVASTRAMMVARRTLSNIYDEQSPARRRRLASSFSLRRPQPPQHFARSLVSFYCSAVDR